MRETSSERRAQLGHFARRLSDFGPLADHTLDVLERCVGATVHHPRGADLTGRWTREVHILLSGWACTVRADAEGERQICSFVLPGDGLGSFWRRPEFSFWSLNALTPLATAPARALLARTPDGRFEHPEIVSAARRAEDYAHHLLADHIVRLGARDAYAGLAHLLLELHGRLERVGLAAHGAFHMPVGQRVLARLMGFSVVHINQTLQRMIADGLFATRGRTVHLLRPDEMARLSSFTARHPPPTWETDAELAEVNAPG